MASNKSSATPALSKIEAINTNNGTAINGYEGGPYYLSNMGVKTMRDGTLSFADPAMLERQFKNNAESLRSFFKDQIVSDNTNIIPKRYSVADTKPGSYAVSVSSGTATIGGVSTTQSGSLYTVASGDPNGIALEINSSNTTGTIHYGRSFITLLQEKLDTFLKFNGLISNKVDGANRRLSELAEKQANLEDRIASLYSRYETQYSAMESTIAGLNETSS